VSVLHSSGGFDLSRRACSARAHPTPGFFEKRERGKGELKGSTPQMKRMTGELKKNFKNKFDGS
jgi:hypothetical protein